MISKRGGQDPPSSSSSQAGNSSKLMQPRRAAWAERLIKCFWLAGGQRQSLFFFYIPINSPGRGRRVGGAGSGCATQPRRGSRGRGGRRGAHACVHQPVCPPCHGGAGSSGGGGGGDDNDTQHTHTHTPPPHEAICRDAPSCGATPPPPITAPREDPPTHTTHTHTFAATNMAMTFPVARGQLPGGGGGNVDGAPLSAFAPAEARPPPRPVCVWGGGGDGESGRGVSPPQERGARRGGCCGCWAWLAGRFT